MPRNVLIMLAGMIIASSSGCCTLHRDSCQSCSAGCGVRPHRPNHGIAAALTGCHHGVEPTPSGPPMGTVSYPYYTVRGPRDFLRNDPPTTGP